VSGGAEAAAGQRSGRDHRVGPADGVLSRRILDEVLILRLEDEEYFGLRGVGRRIWELVLERTSVEGMVDTLVEEFAVDRRILERDVATFLEHLRRNSLVAEDGS
jgi:hypothetical protein